MLEEWLWQLHFLRSQYAWHQLIFVDEMHTNEKCGNRNYGYSKQGEPCLLDAIFVRGEKFSTLGAANQNGFLV